MLFNLGKPTICALNGSAAGYGMDTALGCDIRIMAESAKMAAAFTKRGIVPESGGTWFLPRLIGWSKAAELIFTGRTLSADAVPGDGPGLARSFPTPSWPARPARWRWRSPPTPRWRCRPRRR